MRILVLIKQVPDPAVIARPAPDGSGMALAGVKPVVNPFDEIAVEAALQLREAGLASLCVGASVGAADCAESLRTALAMGLDEARLIETEADAAPLESLEIARALAELVRREGFDLVICGKQGVDGDAGLVGPMLAELLGWPQAAYASRIEHENDRLRVARECDGGIETLTLPLPALITTDLRLNEPRYASLPNIVKAKRKPLQSIPLAELGVTPDAAWRVMETREPPQRPTGVAVQSIAELDAALRQAGALP
ncbi:electron transfer flavoprotein subunit beta/FixA family protein [Magnetofaba australis]|uniref:Electron transfer flavoprotein subunit beta n=1 Tax=Magnetofaba australis IT-1 TaxID=1434232 RepID=A0A1Y2K9L4_9PROT|nr:electron transfer flavoprotein subunit beta/FixA family protein [Magnetofaba australis]OSM07187.1 putative electron transfer flavoprotein subunit beta [Magnetofaba australis IT-1]